MTEKRKNIVNKKYMTIAVPVQTCWFSARNNSEGVRQESSPKSATNHTAAVMGKFNPQSTSSTNY
jgi:hypothetical protein